jgi:hypothetical protein
MLVRRASLLLAVLAAPLAAQWSTDPAVNLSIVTKSGEQVTPKIAATSDGGCYVGWFDNASGNYDVFLQRLDAAGAPQWPAAGLPISTHAQSSSLVDWDLLADASDNCVLVFTDTRAGADLDVYAYKVSPAGAELWGPDGKTLSANSDFEPAPRVCEASDGDLVFAWARIPSGAVDGGIMLQRLAPDGTPRYPAGGLTVVSEAGKDPAFCDIVASDAGNVLLVWVRDITSFASQRHVRAQKFSPAGTAVWPVKSVYDVGAGVPIAHQPGLASDGSGGALVWWHRADASGLFNSLVQHLDAAGTELFAHNGVAVASTPNRNHLNPTLAYPVPGGDIFVFWNEENSLQSQWGLYGQRFNAAGVVQWGAGGLPLMALDTDFKGPPRSVPWKSDALVFTYDEPTAQFGKDRALALRVDAAGNQPWGAPLVISSVPSTKSRLPVAIDCAGVSKVIWEDDRNGTPDVYGQSVRPDGTLGAGLTWTDLGSALAGTHGAPQLAGDGLLCPGLTVTLSLSGAIENSAAALFVGFGIANLPFKGGTLVPAANLLIAGLPTGPSGTLVLSAPWPTGVPSGFAVTFQEWIVDAAGPKGFSATNGLSGTTP